MTAATAQPFGTSLDGFQPDYIVVGSGSAGAAATRRLVDAGARVLLLEAGALDLNPAIHDPARMHELWHSEQDWAIETLPQEHAHGRCLSWPRGKVLGGSSCLNAMIWVRGARADYDNWAYMGAPGWGWSEVEPVFRRIEHRTPGDGGVVSILASFTPDPIQAAILEAGQRAGLPLNPDYNDGEQDGISLMQFTIRDGRRHSAARAYLHPIAADANLRVITGAHAQRLLFDGTRCTGVEFLRDGGCRRAHAGSEVIVCAGTIGSPQLLMISGIGRAAHLRRHGIGVRADLEGVGENLHDHLLVPVICTAAREIGPPAPGLPTVQTHLFWRSRAGLAVPDLQPLHFSVPLYEPWMDGPSNGFSLMAGIVRPQSRGTIRLSGPDVGDPLLIDPNILACAADVDTLIAGVDLCRELAGTQVLRSWGAEERYPGREVKSRADLADYVRRTAITYHHQVGSCRMGTDALAVVDPELRVHGIDGLRVADASVMPAVTTGNTNAPAIMIGERAADFLLADRR